MLNPRTTSWRKLPFTALILVLGLGLGACSRGLIATVGPDYEEQKPSVASRWQAPQPDVRLAHSGNPSELRTWWHQFDDPALLRLIEASQVVSSGVADARARIEDARADMATAISQGLPKLDSQVDIVRARTTFGSPPFDWTRYQAGVQSNWEVDLFGGISRQREAALGSLSARHNAWHDARVAVAVEVANAYVQYRYCEILLRIAEADAHSRKQSARLVEMAEIAGLRPPSDLSLAKASQADGSEQWIRQNGVCESSVKGLVSLSGLSETEVRHLLKHPETNIGRLPEPPKFRLTGLAAETLMQRPDVRAAEQQVAEASARIGVAEARRYPRLSLSGNITPQLQTVSGASLFSPYTAGAAGAASAATYFANTWSIGPTLNLPLFDSGKRIADVEAAEIAYQAAKSRFQSVARTAAKEVEVALVRLMTSEARLPEARLAEAGYQKNFTATDHLYRAGFGSLLELEQARRQTLLARRSLADLEQERVAAWIALYRAAGGGWHDKPDHPPEIPLGKDPGYPLTQQIPTDGRP